MTPRQSQLLAFIAQFQTAHSGVSPSFQEMVTGIGARSKSNVSFLLDQLEKDGRIQRTPRRARDIFVVPAEQFTSERLQRAAA